VSDAVPGRALGPQAPGALPRHPALGVPRRRDRHDVQLPARHRRGTRRRRGELAVHDDLRERRRRLRVPPRLLRHRLHPHRQRPPACRGDPPAALHRGHSRPDHAHGRRGVRRGGPRRSRARHRPRDARRTAPARPVQGQRPGRRARRSGLRCDGRRLGIRHRGPRLRRRRVPRRTPRHQGRHRHPGPVRRPAPHPGGLRRAGGRDRVGPDHVRRRQHGGDADGVPRLRGHPALRRLRGPRPVPAGPDPGPAAAPAPRWAARAPT
jgi:hypothetical protein